MTWNNLTDFAAELNRLFPNITATFQGRLVSYNVSTFFSVTQNGLEVHFVDETTSAGGSIVAWSWDFGDNATSTEQNPSHTYDFAGSYIVTLITTDVAGAMGSYSATVVASSDIEPDPADPTIPVAGFTVVTNSLTASFTDTSTDADGTVVDWNWDFGEAATPSFSYIPTGLSVAFTDTSTVPGSLTKTAWAWDFDDGATSSSQNPTHVYSAGGSYDVELTVTASNGNQTTIVQNVQVTSGATLGIPFGLTQALSGPTTISSNATRFNLFMDGVAPSYITRRIQWAIDNGYKLIFNMTGGSHSDYLTNGVFDSSKWTAKQNTFNTSAIKTYMSLGVAAGAVVGNSVMDEPMHSTWGPKGTMTKASVDAMAVYVKSIFTTLPVCVFHGWDQFEPSKSYHTMDYIIAAYQVRFGELNGWLANTLTMCRRDGHKALFGLNIVNGGNFTAGCHTSNAVCCPQGSSFATGTEGAGNNTTGDHINCRTNPSVMTRVCNTLAPASLGFIMWRYDTEAMSTSSWAAQNQTAFQSMCTKCDSLPRSKWTRG